MIKYSTNNLRLCYCDVCGVKLDATHAPEKACHVCILCAPSQTNEPNVWVGGTDENDRGKVNVKCSYCQAIKPSLEEIEQVIRRDIINIKTLLSIDDPIGSLERINNVVQDALDYKEWATIWMTLHGSVSCPDCFDKHMDSYCRLCSAPKPSIVGVLDV